MAGRNVDARCNGISQTSGFRSAIRSEYEMPVEMVLRRGDADRVSPRRTHRVRTATPQTPRLERRPLRLRRLSPRRPNRIPLPLLRPPERLRRQLQPRLLAMIASLTVSFLTLSFSMTLSFSKLLAEWC